MPFLDRTFKRLSTLLTTRNICVSCDNYLKSKFVDSAPKPIMGKIKLETKPRSEKVLRKTATHLQENVSFGKKSAKSTKKECEEVDSLIFLKEEKEKNKAVGLDDKLKFLKSQLQELLGDVRTENSDSKCLSSSDEGLVELSSQVNKQNSARLKLNSEEQKYNTQQHPSKPDTKFSKWLEQTVDDMTVKSEAFEELPLCHNLPSNTKKSPVVEPKFKSSLLNSSSFSNNLLEQLVYKSIYLQNFEKHLSSSDEDDIKEIRVVKKVKQQKNSTKKPLKKSVQQKFFQANGNFHKPSQKVRNKRTRHVFENDIEEIDLVCNSPYSNNNSVLEVHEETLDVETYDWNEPFDGESQSEIPLHVDSPSKYDKDKPDTKNQETQKRIIDSPVGKLQVQRNWECPICFEQSKGQDVVATQCGHIFCKKCLERNMSKFKNKNCPTCRTDLSKKPPITLFNF